MTTTNSQKPDAFVQMMQQYLNKAYGTKIYPDGVMNEATVQAVARFQKDHGLETTGQMDALTILRVTAAIGEQAEQEAQALQIRQLPDSVSEAKENYDSFVAQTPGEFFFDKQAILDMAEEAIANREDFAYDPNADALYRQYRDQYIREGRLAMEDTMGLAAALTGGYGNSYALTAGQQAYQGYLGQLADVLPQLQSLAYEKYTDETQALQDRYDALTQEKSEAYEAHQDAWSRYDAQRQELYNIYRNTLAQQDDRYDRLYELISGGYTPTASEIKEAGMTQSIVTALQQERQRQLAARA